MAANDKPSFTAHAGEVYLNGVKISRERVDGLEALFDTAVAMADAAEKAAAEAADAARKARDDFFNARCAALDWREDHILATGATRLLVDEDRRAVSGVA